MANLEPGYRALRTDEVIIRLLHAVRGLDIVGADIVCMIPTKDTPCQDHRHDDGGADVRDDQPDRRSAALAAAGEPGQVGRDGASRPGLSCRMLRTSRLPPFFPLAPRRGERAGARGLRWVRTEYMSDPGDRDILSRFHA